MNPEQIKKARKLIDEELKKIVESKVLDIAEMKGKILAGLEISEQEYNVADLLPLVDEMITRRYGETTAVLQEVNEKLKKDINYEDIKNTPDLEALKSEMRYDDSRVVEKLMGLAKRIKEGDANVSVIKKEIKQEILRKIPSSHSDLADIKPDDHHKEAHDLESHLGSEWKEYFERLIGGGFVDDLHKHKETGPARHGGLYNPTHYHDDIYYKKDEVLALIAAIVETDPVFAASAAAGIVAGDITNWDTAFGWGDHSTAGYLTGASISDAVYAAGWDTVGNIAPSKNAIYDKINSMYSGLLNISVGAVAPGAPSIGDLWVDTS